VTMLTNVQLDTPFSWAWPWTAPLFCHCLSHRMGLTLCMNTRPWILLSILLFGLQTAGSSSYAHGPAEEMAEAAKNLLAALSPEQQTKATFEFKAGERMNWHFIPKPRKGLPMGEMTPAQRPLAHALLNTGMSQRGYMKANTIMSLEQILLELEQGKGPKRDPENYFVTIFGTPGGKEPWAWRVEGHHLSLNFTVTPDDRIAVTPSFMGSNPGEIRTGPRKDLRVLGREEDLARKLVKSLTEEQSRRTIYTNVAPNDIVSSTNRPATLLLPQGIPMSQMDKSQGGVFWELIREYVERYRSEVADKDMKRIEAAGPEKIYFAWAGSVEKNQPHYYRIQGPTFLMEYDNTQNGANHVHSVWRDLENDFGEDLLRKHYDESHRK
jgi:hypothetical protein